MYAFARTSDPKPTQSQRRVSRAAVRWRALAVAVPLLCLGVPKPVFAIDVPVAVTTWGGCGDAERPWPYFCWGSDEPGEFAFPAGVAIDDEGYVYVSSYSNERIQKFEPSGELVSVWNIGWVDQIAWGPDNALYASGLDTIRKFSRDGVLIAEWGGPGSGEGELDRPRSIDFDSQGNVFVLGGNYRVQKFTADGIYLSFVGGFGLTPGSFIHPFAMVVLDDDTLVVADSWFGFQHFRPDGTLLGKWAPFVDGDGDGEFGADFLMTVGLAGNVFLSDRENNRVQIMSPGGRFLGKWGTKGFGAGRFGGIEGIAVGRDFAYVADIVNSAVHVFTWHSVIDTEPTGLTVEIDGVERIAPVVVDWPVGSQHDVSVLSQVGPGGRYEFREWSDGGAQSHTVSGSKIPTRTVARFDEFYWLEMTSSPGVEITPESQWVAEGDSVLISASAIGGYATWSGTGRGSYTGELPEATIHPKGPVTQHAEYNAGRVYTLSISASETDPHVNADVATGPRYLYLWMTCAPTGFSAFEAQVVGSLTPLNFTPMNGVLNAGNGEHLLLAVGGCPSGEPLDLLLGRWAVLDDGGELCLEAPDGGYFGVVQCHPVDPQLTLNPRLRGFSSSGAPPCDVGTNGCYEPPPTVELVTGVALATPSLGLSVPRPNPFRGSTQLSYVLPAESDVRVSVFNALGRLVARLERGVQGPGAHQVVWDGRTEAGGKAPAGVYFVRLDTGTSQETRKVTRLSAE